MADPGEKQTPFLVVMYPSFLGLEQTRPVTRPADGVLAAGPATAICYVRSGAKMRELSALSADLDQWLPNVTWSFATVPEGMSVERYKRTFGLNGSAPVVAEFDSKADTLEHMRTVAFLLNRVLREIIKRIEIHDAGKLAPEEKALFDKLTPRLKGITYGSPEYQACLRELAPSLTHHYKTNRHHPEHFRAGVHGMNLIDMLEMMVDWKASSQRHADGDPYKSIELGQTRFGYSDELKALFIRTMDWLNGKPDHEPWLPEYWQARQRVLEQPKFYKISSVSVMGDLWTLEVDIRTTLASNLWNMLGQWLDQHVHVNDKFGKLARWDEARQPILEENPDDWHRTKFFTVPLSQIDAERALAFLDKMMDEVVDAESQLADRRAGGGTSKVKAVD